MVLFLSFLMLIPVVYSSHHYYADIDIYVSNDGVAAIKGVTNHPLLNLSSTQEFTFKDKGYWFFNLTLDDEFSDFIYRLHLPSNAVVNYLKVSTPPRIESRSDEILIVATGENESLSILVQYQIVPLKSSSLGGYMVIAVIIILVIIVLTILVFKRKTSSKRNYNIESLTKRQREIMRIIEKNKKPITQAALEKILKIPKSSLSRNIDSLVRKDIITKEGKGMSNVLFLKNK